MKLPRSAEKQEYYAQRIAWQILEGTLPNGTLVCQSNADARKLLQRIKYWIDRYERAATELREFHNETV